MIPTLVLFTFFVWEPLIESIRLSLHSARGVEIQEFVGLQNYIDVFNDVSFNAAFANTFKYIGWSLVIGFVVPIILAIFISETIRGKSFFRFAVYFPNMVPGYGCITSLGLFLQTGSYWCSEYIVRKVWYSTKCVVEQRGINYSTYRNWH